MAENLSGVPPQVTLSGLEAGPGGGGFSGASQQGLGPGGSQNPFGMEGGLDLAQLMQLLAGQGGEEAGVGTGGNILQSLTQGTLGQTPGGLSAGSFGQTQPGYVAGQSAAGNQAAQAQGQAAGSSDPFSIIQKLLGTAQKGLGAAQGASTASPTGGGTGGSDLTLNTDLGGMAGLGSPGFNTGVASPTVGQDMQGTLGSRFLSDPTIGALFTSGKLNGWDGSAESLNALMASDPGIRDALFQGNIGESLGEQLGGATGGASGFTLGTGAEQGGGTNWLGAGAGGVAGGLGLLNLMRALQSGNAPGAVGGGLQGIGGLLSVLKASPDLANALGVDASALGGAGAGIGGLGGLLSLIQGIQSENPAQSITGLISAIQALNALATGTEVGTTALAASPALAAASGAISAAGPVLGAAAPILMALAQYFASNEESQARRSGWWNNPISGNLYSNATAGVANANNILGQLNEAGLSNVPTEVLMGTLPETVNSLLPYYATAQGGAGGLTASGAAGSPGLQSKAEYTQNFTKAQQGVVGVVNELLKRGVSYEDLGRLPITGNWVLESLNAYNPLNDFYTANAGKYNTEAQALLNPAITRSHPGIWMQSGEGEVFDPMGGGETQMLAGYGQVQPGVLTPQALFEAAQGAGAMGPEKDTHASGLITGMYGGPLWTALARMGTGGPEIQSLIQQHFDPWAAMRASWGANPAAIGTSLMPILQRGALMGTFGGGDSGEAGSPSGW